MKQAKVLFQLEVVDDYPPHSVESVWATELGPNRYRIDNIPWFATEAAYQDIVSVRATVDGELWFDSVVEPARNSLIRVLLLHANEHRDVIEALVDLGCECEHNQLSAMIAVSVPPSTPLSPVQQYLRTEAAAARLDYEEPIIWHDD